eukprot:Polyplicarium_translucidae@DN2953_c0_g1_i3.p1
MSCPKMKKPTRNWKGKTPWGVNPVFLLFYFFTAISLTGNAVFSGEPLQRLLSMTKCLPHLENQAERDTAIKDIVGFGVSMCALLGFPIGLVGDRMGPKITCSIAMTCQAVGFYLLAFGMTPLWMSVGAFALGIGYQAIRNCHLFVAVYFPTRTAFVMSIPATGMCVSLYVPYLMLHATRLVRVEIVVGTYLLLIVIPVAVGDVLLTPFVRPTRADLEKDDEEPEEHKEL